MPELGQYAIPIFLAYGLSLIFILAIILISYMQYNAAKKILEKIEKT